MDHPWFRKETPYVQVVPLHIDEDSMYVKEEQEEYKALDKKHDKGYKYLLSFKKVFLQLLNNFVKQGWVDKINEDDIIKVDKSFIAQDFQNKEADIVYSVKINNQNVLFYMLMELQSTVDYLMPFRLLVYMLEIWRAFFKDIDARISDNKSFKFPHIIPFVLYNGESKWTVAKSFKETLIQNNELLKSALDFKYILLDVSSFEDKDLLEISNVISSVFFIDKIKDKDKLAERLEIALDNMKGKKWDIQIFITWFKNVVQRNQSKEMNRVLNKIIEQSIGGEENMEHAIERILREEREGGIEEGREKGRKEGREEGMEKGKVEITREMIHKKINIHTIAEITKFSVEKIQEIAAQSL